MFQDCLLWSLPLFYTLPVYNTYTYYNSRLHTANTSIYNLLYSFMKVNNNLNKTSLSNMVVLHLNFPCLRYMKSLSFHMRYHIKVLFPFLIQQSRILSNVEYKLDTYEFDDFPWSDDDTCRATLRMFLECGVHEEFNVPMDVRIL